MSYLDKAKALEAIQKQGGKVVNFDLIKSTLKEINQSYSPGLVEWVKTNRPDTWTEIRRTEEAINRAALSGDRATLEDALFRYQNLFSKKVRSDEQFSLPWGESMQVNHKKRLIPEGKGKMPPVKIYSRLFNEGIYIVADQEEMEALVSKGITEAVYLIGEIPALREKNEEHLKAVHQSKELFPGCALA